MRRASVLLVLGVAACHRSATLPQPLESLASLRARIIVLTTEGEEPVLLAEALDPGQTNLPLFHASEGTGISVLHYEAPLAELFLLEGLIGAPRLGQPSRPLPAGFIGRTAILGDGPIEWSPLTSLEGALAQIRIAAPTPVACLEAGGCYASRAQLDENLCSVPCPAPARPDAPTPPEPVIPASMEPCASGWASEALEMGAVICAPPARLVPPCMAGHAQWIDSAACAPVGAPCPAGDWPSVAGGSILYVRPGGSGDGSIAAPFGAIRDAIAAGGPGTIIALARGRYAERVELSNGISLYGACAAETILAPTAANSTTAAIIVRGASSTIRDLRVDPGAGSGLELSNGSSAHLEGSVIEPASFGGLRGDAGVRVRASASIVAVRVSIRGFDNGVQLLGATAEVRHAVLERHHQRGLEIIGANNRARLEDVVLGAVESVEENVILTGSVSIARALIATRSGYGVHARGAGARLAMQDVILREATPGPSPSIGFLGGLYASRGATVAASRVFIDGGTRIGAQACAATLRFVDVVIRGVRAPEGSPAYGVRVDPSVDLNGRCRGPSRLEAQRVALDDIDVSALNLNGAATSALLRDIDIARSRRIVTNGHSGFGVEVGSGVTLDLERIRTRDCGGEALAVSGFGGAGRVRGRITDVTLERTALADGALRLDTFDLGNVDLSVDRVRVHSAGGFGFTAYEDAIVTARDVFVDDAVHVGIRIDNSSVSLSRVQVEGSHAGICFGVGSKTSLRDLVVRGSAPKIGATDIGCGGGLPGAGSGMLLSSDAELSVERFLIEDSTGAGLGLSERGAVLLDGIIRGNRTGLLVPEKFPLGEALIRVRYGDNMVPVERL